MFGETTEKLAEILKRTRPEEAGRVLCEHASDFFDPVTGFSDYIRGLFNDKGICRQDVFLRADISEGYGYKLISGEKRTRRRDTLLRLFLAAGFTLDETNRALHLAGMPALYPAFARDAVLMIAFNSGVNEPAAVDELLARHGMEPLFPSRSAE